MRPFIGKILICLIPMILASWVTYVAWDRYQRGESGGFKLGVDLSGGTILVYEIDLRKAKERADDKDSGAREFDPVKDTNLLAESLKKRIDPTATYNIVIRPAGGAGRVEIILPTGGEKLAREADRKWRAMLQSLEQEWKDRGVKNLEVPRGRVQELIDTIQQQASMHTWSTKLLKDPAAWEELVKNAVGDPAKKDDLGYYSEFDESTRNKIRALKPGQVKELIEIIEAAKDIGHDSGDVWVKTQAWDAMLKKVVARWPELEKNTNDLREVPKGHVMELIGRIETKGNVFSQAALVIIDLVLKRDQPPAGGGDPLPVKDLIDRKAVKEFVESIYGPATQTIEDSINQRYEGGVRSRDLTVEEVQRIKDLISKVGSLEFRILANRVDDAEAIKKAKAYIDSAKTNPDVAKELKDKAIRGEPPPGPRKVGSDELERFTINLPRGKSIVTYSWVELGPQQRHDMHLDNASAKSPKLFERSVWLSVPEDGAVQIKRPGGSDQSYMLQGALIYKRKCVDVNMPEAERNRKQWEYFVLARNPEFDATGKQTPKIDGKYLQSAYSQLSEGRPAVHFVFNPTGGNLFGELTGKNVPSDADTKGTEESQVRRHLAIILDGLVMSAPTINSRITTQGQITGSFTKKEVDNLVNILRSGTLPATLKPQPVSENTIGATLGEDTIEAGLGSVFWAFIAVVGFMIWYYRFAGLVACLALFANLILTIGFMVAVQATFTLAGLAGLVLMLGMAVDANVLIYERFREERDRGATVALALRNGYSRALPTIIDTHLTSIFTAVVLYIVGNDQLKGFGVSLTVGLLISLFTSLYMTHVIFDIWVANGWLPKLTMMRLLTSPKIDFMRVRYFFFTLTVGLTIAGAALFVGRMPDNLNIDFIGGTAYGGQLKPGEARTIPQYRELLEETAQAKWLHVKEVKEVEGSGGRKFTITYENPNKTIETREVFLANVPSFDTVAEREKNVKERASKLKDWSVEQVFLSGARENNPDTTRFFTVRTSEKETELVQLLLDRLLRVEKDGQMVSLLEKIPLRLETDKLHGKGHEARFIVPQPEQKPGEETKTVDASPSFIRTLLVKELHRAFQVDEKAKLHFGVDLVGEGTGREGRFSRMKVSFQGELTKVDLEKIKNAMERTVAEFQARPQPERLENFDSELAADTRLRALQAILASWVAVMLYLWFRFGNWTWGLAAVLCLIHDLFFTLGLICVCTYLHGTPIGNALLLEDFKIDLTTVAALLTLVGYSVADTIVVFDRIREVRGKNPELTAQMVNDSINQTLSRTLLTSFTSWLVVVVLYIFGGPGVKLFAFVMVVGVMIGTYSSIYIASPLLLIFGEGRHAEARGRTQTQPASSVV